MLGGRCGAGSKKWGLEEEVECCCNKYLNLWKCLWKCIRGRDWKSFEVHRRIWTVRKILVRAQKERRAREKASISLENT